MINILLVVLGASLPPQAPPIDPQFTLVNCLCTDTGVCNCKSGECGCADCQPTGKPTGKNYGETPAKRTRSIREFVGYETRRECTGSGCRYVRVPVYRTVEVDATGLEGVK